MSNQTSRTTSAKNINPPVPLRVATICSPNSYRRPPSEDFPNRFSGVKRSASNDKKSNPHVSSKTNSINPQSSNVRARRGSSTRRTKHSKENCTLPSSASARSLVGGTASCHLRNTENAVAWSITDPPRFAPFAELPERTLSFIQTAIVKAKSRSSPQRPLQESPSNSNGRARNYSVRNVKRKQPSNSPAASRKRSSGA
jgi:hypothetical protein